MPTLFDDHEEFNEWFSKDIESHAENKSNIDKSKYYKVVYYVVANSADTFHSSTIVEYLYMLLNVMFSCQNLLMINFGPLKLL